ncbi:hypothetical protein GCM10027290_49310 [Micromonospora sonneratiae]
MGHDPDIETTSALVRRLIVGLVRASTHHASKASAQIRNGIAADGPAFGSTQAGYCGGGSSVVASNS